MQEDINRRTVSLCINGGKISGKILKTAILYAMKKSQSSSLGKNKSQTPPRGKMTLADLTGQTDKLTNIQISDQNIGSFDKVARKYDIDYALKKDSTSTPPRYYVFFKAKDVDVMNAAFKEYTQNMSKQKLRPSIKRKLHKNLKIVKYTSRKKIKNMKRSIER